jgi:hypothetical protein
MALNGHRLALNYFPPYGQPPVVAPTSHSSPPWLPPPCLPPPVAAPPTIVLLSIPFHGMLEENYCLSPQTKVYNRVLLFATARTGAEGLWARSVKPCLLAKAAVHDPTRRSDL